MNIQVLVRALRYAVASALVGFIFTAALFVLTGEPVFWPAPFGMGVVFMLVGLFSALNDIGAIISVILVLAFTGRGLAVSAELPGTDDTLMVSLRAILLLIVVTIPPLAFRRKAKTAEAG